LKNSPSGVTSLNGDLEAWMPTEFIRENRSNYVAAANNKSKSLANPEISPLTADGIV